MAKRVFTYQSFTPTAVADTANYTDNAYMALQGGSTTQRVDITEVQIVGLATSAGVAIMTLGRDSTVGASLTALSTGQSDAPLDPATAALAATVKAFTASTTKPQRDSAAAKLAMALNCFGGFQQWRAPIGVNAEFRLLGNAASFGEASLSAFSGGAPQNIQAHMVYEPL